MLVALATIPCSWAFSGGVGSARPLEAAKVRPSFPIAPAARSAVSRIQMQGGRGVPLTGQTLASALEFRCDTTGAAYAIYWSRIRDELKPTGVHVANPKVTGYVEASKKIVLDANGQGPIAKVMRNMEPDFFPDVVKSNLKRKELAFQNGVNQVVLMAFEDGVIEFGNVRTNAPWPTIPEAPSIPKQTLRRAFEDLGALYAMVWERNGNDLTVIADYENPRDKAMRLALRGDGKSFVGLSKGLVLDATGNGPVGAALRKGDELVVVFDENADNTLCSSMKRAEAAKEFGISEVHFYPFKNEITGQVG